MRLELHSHPATPPAQPFAVWANAEASAAFGESATLNLWFGVGAPADRFRIAAPSDDPQRRDGLWRTTCFEAFLRDEAGAAYREWNFAPSGDWAAYDFSARREGMAQAAVASAPYLRVEDNLTWWGLGATIAIPSERRFALGLTAVIEEADGTISYWALAHGGEKPDFHDPACFVARLP
ncbi:DOMON-like domain-containing protein [Sphingomonas ginkgonis]|uniref:DOMON-like domain-containing protein n=1 Tax=Sphingomonas ginkgonis TaxID=2315330 RepID=A0A3R9YM25_9SPHN|nr:DOMON-like domain-containing protein [Sphingomonas ginkgonis]RST30823.1 DOMON-like domain-containing protein [Sphingomonas ginkgonis]